MHEPGSARLLPSIDRILRGQHLQPEALAQGRIGVPIALLVKLGFLLGALYGICLGAYALFQGGEQAGLQILTSALKVPLLFLLTLLVTFPSLYVFSALCASPLGAAATLRLLLLAIVVSTAVLASLGPVFAFFAASTESYAFMTLLNVACFTVGGLIGLVVLRRATRALYDRAPSRSAEAEHRAPPPFDPSPAPSAAQEQDPAPTDVPQPPAPANPAYGSRHRPSANPARRLLAVWCLVYGVVGAQMGWLLRPFLGAPGLPFAVLRPRESNVFAAILEKIGDLFRG